MCSLFNFIVLFLETVLIFFLVALSLCAIYGMSWCEYKLNHRQKDLINGMVASVIPAPLHFVREPLIHRLTDLIIINADLHSGSDVTKCMRGRRFPFF